MLIAFILAYFIIGAVFVATLTLVSAIEDGDDKASIKAYCRQWQFWRDVLLSILLWPIGAVMLMQCISDN